MTKESGKLNRNQPSPQWPRSTLLAPLWQTGQPALGDFSAGDQTSGCWSDFPSPNVGGKSWVTSGSQALHQEESHGELHLPNHPAPVTADHLGTQVSLMRCSRGPTALHRKHTELQSQKTARFNQWLYPVTTANPKFTRRGKVSTTLSYGWSKNRKRNQYVWEHAPSLPPTPTGKHLSPTPRTFTLSRRTGRRHPWWHQVQKRPTTHAGPGRLTQLPPPSLPSSTRMWISPRVSERVMLGSLSVTGWRKKIYWN